MKSPAPGHPSTAGFWGLGRQVLAPALAALLLLAVILLWGANFAFLQQAREGDLARVARHAKIAKLLMESRLPHESAGAILTEMKNLGLDTAEFLPSTSPPAGPNPRHIPQQSLVEAWVTVNAPDGKPAGILRLRRPDDSSRIMLAATRRFAAAFVLGGLALCGVFLWATRVLVVARIERLTGQILALSPDARPSAAASGDPVANLSTAIAECSASVRKEREALHLLLAGHGEAACLGTAEGEIIEFNDAYCKLLGKAREELIAQNYLDQIPPAERTDVVNSLRRIGPGNPDHIIEHRVVSRDGKVRWMRWRNIALPAGADKAPRILSFGTDITAEKAAYAALDELRCAFDQMQSLARTGSITWDFARDRMEWTAEAARLLGIRDGSAEPSLDTLLAAVCPEHRDTLGDLFRRARETGDPFEMEFCIGQPGKYRTYLQSRAEVRADRKTKLLSHLTCTLRDVTGLRQAQEAQAREFRFREAVEGAVGVGIVVMNRECLPQSANRTFLQMIGWTEDELRAMRPPYPFWPEEDLPAIEEALRLTMAGDSPPGGFELKFRHKDGKIFDVLVNTVGLFADNGEHLGHVSSITDITSVQETRRGLSKAEAAVRKELAFRKAVEGALRLGIWVSDMQGRVEDINAQFLEMTGLTREEVLAQKPPFSWWPPEHIPSIQKAFDQFVAGQAPPGGFEFTFRHKDGSRFDVLDLVAPMLDADGRQTGWISSLVDVTNIQKTRRQLLEANEILSVATDVAELGVWILEPVACRAEWSRRSFALFGDPDGRDSTETYHRVVPPAERERSDAYLHQVVKSGESIGRNEMDAVWPDGSIHRIASHFRVIREEKTGATVIVGIHRDITGFLRREQDLRSALERQRIAIESAGLGVWDWNPRTGKLTWDRRSFAIFGHPDSTGEQAVWQATISPEEREALARKMKSLASGHETSGSDRITVHWPDGQPRLVVSNYSIIRDEAGEAVAVIGVNRNATAEEQSGCEG